MSVTTNNQPILGSEGRDIIPPPPVQHSPSPVEIPRPLVSASRACDSSLLTGLRLHVPVVLDGLRRGRVGLLGVQVLGLALVVVDGVGHEDRGLGMGERGGGWI